MQNSDSIFISLKEFCEIAISKGGNPYASYVLNYYLDHYSRMPFSFNERTFILLVDFVLKTAKYYDISPSALDYYKDLANKVKPFLPGNKFPNISLADFSGKKHSLYDQKHQFTIIYFWSAGCESCKKDLEILENLYKTKKNDYDFEVFSIDLDQNLETSASYHIDHPFEWLVLKADSEHIKQRYGLDISLTPELYILDSQKRILNKTVLYSQIEESIKAFLPKK
jgi:peroxiredoxin